MRIWRKPQKNAKINSCGMRSQDCKRHWRPKRWKLIFSSLPCSKSRRDVSRAKKLATRHLRGHPVVGARARHVERGTDVLFSRGQPARVLPGTAGKQCGRG